MNIAVLTDEIARARSQFSPEMVNTPDQLREVFRLRHQVYCVERGFEAGDNGEETDEYDCHSRHLLLRSTSDGEVVGTVRIIAPDPSNLGDSFPMQRLCDASLLPQSWLATTGEISRFSLSKQRRLGRSDVVLLRLAMLRGVVQISYELGLTHWLAVMERSLIRLHQTNEIWFEPVGPLVSYHGIRQPTVGEIVPVLERIRREQYPTWDYLTNGGRWYGKQRDVSKAA